MVLEGQFLLYTLNEYLAHTALLVQPLCLPADRDDAAPLYDAVDVPLPLPASQTVTGAVHGAEHALLKLSTLHNAAFKATGAEPAACMPRLGSKGETFGAVLHVCLVLS